LKRLAGRRPNHHRDEAIDENTSRRELNALARQHQHHLTVVRRPLADMEQLVRVALPVSNFIFHHVVGAVSPVSNFVFSFQLYFRHKKPTVGQHLTPL
jgi:hypothetical protein